MFNSSPFYLGEPCALTLETDGIMGSKRVFVSRIGFMSLAASPLLEKLKWSHAAFTRATGNSIYLQLFGCQEVCTAARRWTKNLATTGVDTNLDHPSVPGSKTEATDFVTLYPVGLV